MEVRYVGTRGHGSWRTNTNGNNGANAANGSGTLDMNEYNIFENGFINEFRQLSGRTPSFYENGRFFQSSEADVSVG